MSWKKDSGYIGSPASAQTLPVFQRIELNIDYPPHFMKHLSPRSLDRKPFTDLTVKLLSFLYTYSSVSKLVKIRVKGTSEPHASFKDWYRLLLFPYISHVLAASVAAGCDVIPISVCCIPCLLNGFLNRLYIALGRES